MEVLLQWEAVASPSRHRRSSRERLLSTMMVGMSMTAMLDVAGFKYCQQHALPSSLGVPPPSQQSNDVCLGISSHIAISAGVSARASTGKPEAIEGRDSRRAPYLRPPCPSRSAPALAIFVGPPALIRAEIAR
jgi:hypothetical protein